MTPILPPATIGIFGSGQLGRMLALAARAMGYRVDTFSPEADSPTGQVADREVVGAYIDADAVRAFVSHVDVVTFEFENVPASVAQIAVEAGIPVRPGGNVLHVAQNRAREKTFLLHSDLPVTPFRRVDGLATLQRALDIIGYPAILKTAAFGYDGKGQARINESADAATAWQAIGEQYAILEAYLPFAKEVSVVAARGVDGTFAHFGVIENLHKNHILDLSLAPAHISPAVAATAVELARATLDALDVVGVMCVEFFLTAEDTLLINEIAPRPHNSGHLTIEAFATSQFEQQLRAVCGLPLGSTEQLRPAAMANLLGDHWLHNNQLVPPNWTTALATCKLHLYGKAEPRVGRKMGHLTALATSVEDAQTTVLTARTSL